MSLNVTIDQFEIKLASHMPDEATLLGTLYVLGTPFHFWFIEVIESDAGEWVAVLDPYNRLADVNALDECRFQTTEIGGKHYIGFAYPHSD